MEIGKAEDAIRQEIRFLHRQQLEYMKEKSVIAEKLVELQAKILDTKEKLNILGSN